MSRSHKRSSKARRQFRQTFPKTNLTALYNRRCTACGYRIRVSHNNLIPCFKCGGRLEAIGNK